MKQSLMIKLIAVALLFTDSMVNAENPYEKEQRRAAAKVAQHPTLESMHTLMEQEKRASKSSRKAHDKKHIMKDIDSSKRPVIGVLSEPLRGKVQSKGTNDEVIDLNSYIPKAHVKFLEQAGITVVPVSYQSTPEELDEMMNKLSGLYIPGDSQKTLTDIEYKKTFYHVLKYVEEQTY